MRGSGLLLHQPPCCTAATQPIAVTDGCALEGGTSSCPASPVVLKGPNAEYRHVLQTGTEGN